jgi:hypothetical protein
MESLKDRYDVYRDLSPNLILDPLIPDYIDQPDQLQLP